MKKLQRFASTLFAIDIVVQLLVLQPGTAVLTDGAAYKVAPDVTIVDVKSGKPIPTPSPGALVRLTFDSAGVIHTIAGGVPKDQQTSDRSAIASFAVLPAAQGSPEPSSAFAAFNLKRVMVTFTVRVPATTHAGDAVYLTDSELAWNPVGIRMDRIDLLRYRAVLALPSGADFHYLYTRGNGQTIELGAKGIQRKVRTLQPKGLEPLRADDVVERWGDEVGNTLLPAPHASPTPFNPAPYPNVPKR
jgi:hypothetical protein